MAYVGDTLFVRHLPKVLNVEERQDLLKYYGATSVKCMSDAGKMQYSAFATFSNAEAAQKALQGLHQLEVLGCRLVVQYAHRSFENDFPRLSEKTGSKEADDKHANVSTQKEISRLKMQEFGRNLNSIAQQFSMLYPISPRLKYRYPPPSPSILANISESLVANPKFYTQVLHLMNKMSLPAPFGPAVNNPIVFPDALEVARARSDVVSGESELESDEEEHPREPSCEMQMKRQKKQPNAPRKRQMLQILKKQSHEETPKMDPVDVFETPTPQQATKKIAIKITPTVSLPQEIPEVAETSPEANPSQDESFVSKKVLDDNRMTEDEMKKLPVFKDYSAGDPTPRLYLKNLAKQVEQKDLHFIYGRYVDFESDMDKSLFDVRVMQGPMRGQAFVTLPSRQKAELALKDTNGYVLMGKPMVVQFAKSPRTGQPK